MGIYLRLAVNPNRISVKQWDAVYQESLYLLERFPAPLMRLAAQQTAAGTRLVWTGAIVQSKGARDEHWEVDGDLRTNLRAEGFRLYRVFDRQFRERTTLPDKDVLWSTGDYGSVNGHEVFGDKTQGFPYHLAILAVAVLVESRLPGCAVVSGDIDRRQAEEVVQWINSILPQPVSLPVCFDLARLHSRLAPQYQDADSLYGRIEELYRGPEDQLLAGLAERFGAPAVVARMKRDLAGYRTLGQLGAIELIGKFLRLTRDPARLIEFVEEVNQSRAATRRFSLEELFCLTYNQFSGASVERANPARKLKMKTDEDVWAGLMDKFTGEDGCENLVTPTELLAAFTAHAPSLRRKLERLMAKTSPAPRSPSQPVDETSDEETPHGVHYILQQVDLQCETRGDGPEVFLALGKRLGELADKQKSMISTDPHFYAGLLSCISGESGLPLREGTWARIDAETNVEVLRRLVVLAAIDRIDLEFSELRKRVFETPDQWALLLDPPPPATSTAALPS
ncbi:MAG: hypothetical protein JNL98_12660 [Bryobacterales bacterium]|nr:hypothetical protein [Bryobacterales bacterium]